jgi:hypothetical protein
MVAAGEVEAILVMNLDAIEDRQQIEMKEQRWTISL